LVAARTEELEDSLAELASAHDQLVRTERLAAIGQLASAVGHELRNPLGVISNALYLLRGDFGPAPSEPALRHLNTADREISAATVIVSDLLEFARERQPVIDHVELRGLVDEVLSIAPPPSGIAVAPQLPDEPVQVPADRDMLRQVLLNLVTNAYQAMPDGGLLTLTVTGGAGVVQVRVQDTGLGMTPETQSRLFEPFFTTKARGVGLGLAVSRRLVEAHGGDIVVESEEGQGSTFRVVLPSIARPRSSDSVRIDLGSEAEATT
jgi:signal transduction histidine kinase